MSVGLIDWIFQNLDSNKLNRSEILNYLKYLNEITRQERSVDRIVKYCSYKVSLEKRLVQLDQDILNSFRKI